MYDVCWIRSETGLMPKGTLLDTMVAASLIDENRLRYSLDSLSKDYLKDHKYKYDLKEKSQASPYFINDPMSHMNELPYEMVKDYAEQDVNLTLRLWNLFEKTIHQTRSVTYHGKTSRKTLTNIFKLETDLFPCLVEMRFKGVRVDTEKAKVVGAKLKKRSDNLIKLITARTGIKIDMWAAASIKKLLDKLEIKDYKETPKSKMPQLPKNYLKTHKHRFLRFIATARECDKAQNAFVKGLLKFVHKGRIHADINQIRSDFGGTVTGRFSMSNPNLQQIPAKGLIGKKMRELFLPEEGERWGSFDYSQQEPRLVVHYALKNKMDGAETLADAYTKDPSTDFHKIVAKMANIDRKTAKTINLGLFYGMGKTKLSMQLDLDKDEARELFNYYHNKVPFVRNLSSGLQDFANSTQLIYTLEDRFCRFDKWEPISKEWDEEKRMFIVRRYEKNEETGENEMKEIPVPILPRRQAEDAYLAARARSLQDPAPQALRAPRGGHGGAAQVPAAPADPPRPRADHGRGGRDLLRRAARLVQSRALVERAQRGVRAAQRGHVVLDAEQPREEALDEGGELDQELRERDRIEDLGGGARGGQAT